MESSRIKLIFSILFFFIFIFALISQKLAYKMSQKIFSQIFMKISICHIFLNECQGCLFKNLTFQGVAYSSRAFIYKFKVLFIQLFSLTQDKQLKKLQIFVIISVSSSNTFISSLASSLSQGEMNRFMVSLSPTKIKS